MNHESGYHCAGKGVLPLRLIITPRDVWFGGKVPRYHLGNNCNWLVSLTLRLLYTREEASLTHVVGTSLSVTAKGVTLVNPIRSRQVQWLRSVI